MTDIYFRTDGNSTIATGHLMRCLAIARACAKKNAAVAFIVSDEQSLSLLQENFAYAQEFETLCLHSDYTDMPAELMTLFALTAPADNAASDRKPWIFVDSYYATPKYLSALRDVFRVAYLDDLRSFDCPVDLVINYDTDKNCIYYASARCRLLGAQYTPLREQFENTAYTVRPSAGNVLLSTGGTDPYAVAYHLLDAVYHTQADDMRKTKPTTSTADSHLPVHDASLSCPPDIPLLQSLHYHILTSSANTRYDALLSYAKEQPAVHIHKNVTDVASLMASCDLAVCAGGTTLCELCAVGVPTVSYLMADNQLTAVKTYAAAGLIPYAGDVRPEAARTTEALSPVNRSVIAAVLSFMTYMSQNMSMRQKSSQSMRAFLDGTGAVQIAGALLS